MEFEINKIYNLHLKELKGEFRLLAFSGEDYTIGSLENGQERTISQEEFIGALGYPQEVQSFKTSSQEVALVRKVNKPLGLKSNSQIKFEISDFERIKNEWLSENLDMYNLEYQDGIKAKVENLEIGASYYQGSSSYGFTAFIIDGIIKTKNKYKKGKKDYVLQVRQWNWDTGSWDAISNRHKDYQYDYELQDFIKDITFPKLSTTPDKLWEEAEKALLNDDVGKYAMDLAQAQDANGPDTQLMHIGSKESLLAVQKDLETKRGHAIAIQRTMGMVIEQRKRQLEMVKDKMNAMLVVFEKQIRKIVRVITTIELYLGIEEEIVQIQEGPCASVEEPICIRQALMFMDEEVGDPWDDGQGLEWDEKGLAAFDDWLTRNENYKKVIPEKRGIAAFQARRNSKERASHGNPFANLAKIKADMQTFLLIRNGDNLYRLITDKISFRPRLFPRRDELQRLLDYWKIADEIENKKKNPEAWMSLDHLSDNDKERFSAIANSNHRLVGDAKEYAEDSVFFYKMRITLFQGLIDRSTILFPLKEGFEYKLFSPAAQEQGLVRLIYDDELTLPSGKKSFWNWIKDLNSTINYGSRIVLSHNWGFLTTVGSHREMEEVDFKRSNEIHQERLDDRYGSGRSGNWSHIPPRPPEGMYFVNKGERWQNEPVWVENPFFNPELIETPATVNYCPEYRSLQFPKDLKTYKRYSNRHREEDYHIESNPHVRMTFDQQVAYFGKVVDKGNLPSKEELKQGIQLHGVVRNPRKIHK